MNDLSTLQQELDALDTGLPATPDLHRIHRAGRRQRRVRRSARGVVGAVAVLGLTVAAVPALRPPTPFSAPGSLFAADDGGGTFVTLPVAGWKIGNVSDSYGVREMSSPTARRSSRWTSTPPRSTTATTPTGTSSTTASRCRYWACPARCGPTPPTTTR